MDGTDRRARLARSRLYLVLEARPRGEDPAGLLDAALRGGVDVVQLRDKELPDDELVRAAEPFRRACAAHGALFVLNDRPELVERCGADGVHVGQGDASVAAARRLVGTERLVGLSASTREELERADAARTISASAPSSARRRSRRRTPAGSSSFAQRATGCACPGSRSAASTKRRSTRSLRQALRVSRSCVRSETRQIPEALRAR